jgi:serine/threonine protein kinase
LEFLYIIGRGGFGRVWKVKIKNTNEYFAAKVMSKAKIILRRSEENVLGEKKILSKIYHPFIVNMYFSFQDYDNLYLLMDFLSGGDLRYHLSHKKPCVFTEIQTKFFISNILIALDYIHSQKIIHRDIKPENLVLDLDGYVRVTDFGIAVINDNKDNSKESSGTAGYMAPEVILQQGHSYPADFFALGVIGYEFMIGHRPYHGRNRKQVKDYILSYQAKINFNNKKKGWSENSRDFINKLLQRRPVKRLGYGGIKEIKNHPWLKDINWDLLKKKKIRAPYIPRDGKDYFDKKYCQEEKTNANYNSIVNVSGYQHIFNNYTFINLNYISRLNKKKNNNANEQNLRQLSFSETLNKGKHISSKHLNYSNCNSNTFLNINKNFCSVNKLSKNNINKKENNIHPRNKPSIHKSTNQINRYYNIGFSKDKEKDCNINCKKSIDNEKSKENIKDNLDKDTINENKDNGNNNSHRKYSNRCFSSENIRQDKKLINLKELHKIIEKNIMKKTNGLIKYDSHKSFKDLKSKSILSKSRTNKILFNYNKSSFIEKDKDKEKDNIFNSTTKEKSTKEKTSGDQDKNNIKRISKKEKNNVNNNNNNKLILAKKENLKSTNENNKIKNKNKKNIKSTSKDSFFESQIFNKDKKISTKLIKNSNKNETKSKISNKSEIKSNNINNENDYHIKVIHKKVYKMRNKDKKKKELMNHKSNISVNKNNSMNGNYLALNSSEKGRVQSSKYFSVLRKNRKDYYKNNIMFNSERFNEFRKKKMKNEKKKINKSNENINKETKEKKKNKNNCVNDLNETDKIRVLKFDDYFRNTGLDKESKKNNYYILDKFVSI